MRGGLTQMDSLKQSIPATSTRVRNQGLTPVFVQRFYLNKKDAHDKRKWPGFYIGNPDDYVTQMMHTL